MENNIEQIDTKELLLEELSQPLLITLESPDQAVSEMFVNELYDRYCETETHKDFKLKVVTSYKSTPLAKELYEILQNNKDIDPLSRMSIHMSIMNETKRYIYSLLEDGYSVVVTSFLTDTLTRYVVDVDINTITNLIDVLDLNMIKNCELFMIHPVDSNNTDALKMYNELIIAISESTDLTSKYLVLESDLSEDSVNENVDALLRIVATRIKNQEEMYHTALDMLSDE